MMTNGSGGGYRSPKDSNVVDGRYIGLEKPEVYLTSRPWFQVFVKKCKNVSRKFCLA